ncbi:hypothetical protein MTBPR1_140027 [Candidatus Terasakiella magnetica]|uniref:Uncharacterized protein n=1 Tax=Candidatus Terasakiella magnetica TaxID=1867952 RepID=A0A1C3RF68_9PROT|nr:hypothetical protein [Candidatus Terasakiella magnetica]SCA55909.1 hypothetical protein MTBPR1_140027 [Candidatus Terasakiella magnetica]
MEEYIINTQQLIAANAKGDLLEPESYQTIAGLIPTIKAAINDYNDEEQVAAVQNLLQPLESIFIQNLWTYEYLDKAVRLPDEVYWHKLLYFYIEAENLGTDNKRRDQLLRSLFVERQKMKAKKKRKLMMYTTDRQHFSQLPESFTIYRGQDLFFELGWSWTLAPQVAKFFASRFNQSEYEEPVILEAMVSKKDVIAFSNIRDEFEVIIDPLSITKYTASDLEVYKTA